MSTPKVFRVFRISPDEAIAGLPTLEDYSVPPRPVDILVIPAGFEPRVLAASRQLATDLITVDGSILVGWYQTNQDDNLNRYGELQPLLESFGAPIEKFDAEDPVSTGQALACAIDKVPPDRTAHVVFDISGASSTLILSVMAALVDQKRPIRLTIYYATAAVYDNQTAENDRPALALQADDAREQGVERVSHNALCAGFHHDHLPATVIALPSMYTDRLESCLSHLNVGPMTGSQDNLFWILPSTNTPEHQWRQDAVRSSVEALVRRYQGYEEGAEVPDLLSDDQVVTCDVSSYQSCLKLIVTQVDRYPGRNISIVHMGTKLQAIGVALAVAARKEVAVVTARPAAFNAKSYSDGIEHLYQLVFSDLNAAVQGAAKIGSLVVEA